MDNAEREPEEQENRKQQQQLERANEQIYLGLNQILAMMARPNVNVNVEQQLHQAQAQAAIRPHPQSVNQELRQAFAGPRQPERQRRRGPRVQSWTMRFFCLDRNTTTLPSRSDMQALASAGLGKTFFFNVVIIS